MTNTDGARSAVAAEYPACVQHEALINHAFDGRDVAIICPNVADGLGEQMLADAAMTHPVRHTSRLGLPSERLEDVALAVGELATNSIRHGGGSGVLRIWADDGHVVCEVRDGGHIEDRLAGRIPAAPRQIGGYGLLIVNDLADLVRTRTGPAGTAIRLHFLVR
jgi:anti-sigma regulatory factor (Ser/Thr protein kinase)